MCSESDVGNVFFVFNVSFSCLILFSSQFVVLGEVVNLLFSVQIQVEEVIGELNCFVDYFDVDFNCQQQVEECLDVIYFLVCKYWVQFVELVDLQQCLFDELEVLNVDDEVVGCLGDELVVYVWYYQEKVDELSCLCQVVVVFFVVSVEQEMQCLGMFGGCFVIVLYFGDSVELQVNGLESVEFLVSVNFGQLLKGLVKVVLGGELLWISLVIQVIMVQILCIFILVFDEVDVGIGGFIVEVVGQLLCCFGECGQVFIVIYLLQVVVQGYQYLFVYKECGSSEICMVVVILNKVQWIEEIVCMFGGVDLIKEFLVYVKKLVNLVVQN